MTEEDIAQLEAQVSERDDKAAAALHDALVRMHHSGDARILCRLHRLAATYWGETSDAGGLHLTHAFVYALEAGLEEEASDLRSTLSRSGRI